MEKNSNLKEESKQSNNASQEGSSQPKQKDGTETLKFSKESIDYSNDKIDNQDP